MQTDDLQDHIIILGFGRVGQVVLQSSHSTNFFPCLIDPNKVFFLFPYTRSLPNSCQSD